MSRDTEALIDKFSSLFDFYDPNVNCIRLKITRFIKQAASRLTVKNDPKQHYIDALDQYLEMKKIEIKDLTKEETEMILSYYCCEMIRHNNIIDTFVFLDRGFPLKRDILKNKISEMRKERVFYRINMTDLERHLFKNIIAYDCFATETYETFKILLDILIFKMNSRQYLDDLFDTYGYSELKNRLNFVKNYFGLRRSVGSYRYNRDNSDDDSRDHDYDSDDSDTSSKEKTGDYHDNRKRKTEDYHDRKYDNDDNRKRKNEDYREDSKRNTYDIYPKSSDKSPARTESKHEVSRSDAFREPLKIPVRPIPPKYIDSKPIQEDVQKTIERERKEYENYLMLKYSRENERLYNERLQLERLEAERLYNERLQLERLYGDRYQNDRYQNDRYQNDRY